MTDDAMTDDPLDDIHPTMEQVQAYLAQADVGERVDTIPGASGRFGYDPTNPIPVHHPEGEYDYLISLQSPCYRPFRFHRPGSLEPGPDGHHIDQIDLICRRGCCQITLYMDMYHPGPSALLPEGLRRGAPKGQGVLSYVEDFPARLPEAIAIAIQSARRRQIRSA